MTHNLNLNKSFGSLKTDVNMLLNQRHGSSSMDSQFTYVAFTLFETSWKTIVVSEKETKPKEEKQAWDKKMMSQSSNPELQASLSKS